MTASDKLLAINIFDDGPMNPKGTHTAPGTTGNLDTVKFLEDMFEKTLKDMQGKVFNFRNCQLTDL